VTGGSRGIGQAVAIAVLVEEHPVHARQGSQRQKHAERLRLSVTPRSRRQALAKPQGHSPPRNKG
jgi:NAD(P)-dependent dehydrogenase (short-subunit alcohol dehydrogenase family)